MGFRPIEVYPYAAFRVLTGLGVFVKQGTLAGTRSRVEALEAVGVRAGNLAM